MNISDYIKREDAIHAVRHAWAKGLEPTQYIELIPAADVRENVQGEWIEVITEAIEAMKRCVVNHDMQTFMVLAKMCKMIAGDDFDITIEKDGDTK